MYILFQSIEQAELYQSQADDLLGFPETPDRVEFKGAPTFAPVEVGLAEHYHPIMRDKDNIRIALPKVDDIATPEGATEVEALPEDWYPPAPELGL